MTRKLLLVALGAALAVAVAIGLSLMLPRGPSFEAEYDRIQPGMTMQEVVAIMDGQQPLGAGGFWGYEATFYDKDSDTYVDVTFVNSRVRDKKLARGGGGWLQKLRDRLGW